jgi:hypothetical protein
MKHIVRSTLLVDACSVAISAHDFARVKQARLTLSSGFNAEEIFDLLLSNYLDVEAQCLSAATQRLARNLGTYAAFYDHRAPINRAIVNFLSTARLYVDQIGSKVSACLEGSVGSTLDVKQLLKREYDSAFDFRFVEALRNHVQHSGSAVHTLKTEWNTSPPPTKFEVAVHVSPICERVSLAQDGKFKASVLSACPTTINLLDAIRVYTVSISRIHREVREGLESRLTEAHDTISSLRMRLAGKCEGDLDALVAVALDTEGKDSEIVPLILEWERVRRILLVRNVGLPDKRRSFVSGRGDK